MYVCTNIYYHQTTIVTYTTLVLTNEILINKRRILKKMYNTCSIFVTFYIYSNHIYTRKANFYTHHISDLRMYIFIH